MVEATLPVEKPRRLRRVFFALWPAAEVTAAFDRVTDNLELPRGARRIDTTALHVTLAFLGSVPEEEIETLIALAKGIEFPPVSIVFNQLGCWRKPGIVWAGSSLPCPPLALFVTRLQASLAAHGFAIEAGDFLPHVTLLRNACVRLKLRLDEPIFFDADSFQLVESLPGVSGSVYVTLWDKKIGGTRPPEVLAESTGKTNVNQR